MKLDDIDAIEERLYEHNSHASGRHDEVVPWLYLKGHSEHPS
jgi:hypothetical protein